MTSIDKTTGLLVPNGTATLVLLKRNAAALDQLRQAVTTSASPGRGVRLLYTRLSLDVGT
jgi:hypothetical protein